MNDGGALLTKEQMHAKLHEMARDMPVVRQGLELAKMTEASGEETALIIAHGALEALRATQEDYRRLLERTPPRVLVDRRNIIDEG